MDERENPAAPENQENQENQAGRRLAKPGRSRGKIAIAVVALVLVALMGGYLGICAYAAGDKVLPGVEVAGTDLGGMTLQEAKTALEQVSQSRFDALELPLQIGGETVTFSAKDAGVRLDADSAADAAVKYGKDGFFAAGGNFLAGLFGAHPVDNAAAVVVDDPAYMDQILAQAESAVSQKVEEMTWKVEDNETAAILTLTKGRTGQSVDKEQVRAQLLTALSEGASAPIQVEVHTTPPQEPDFQKLATEVDREPVNAALDPESGEVIPHKLGLTVDAGAAKAAYDALAEGESATVELTTQEPEITTIDLRASLFRDVLGEASSKFSNVPNRTINVKLAAAACNGKILLPGEQMSYNATTGQRTYAKGYRAAQAYIGGKSVDTIGGGVCQPSSTLYLACLNADLKIVDRKNHMFAVGYVPDGMDATVSWPNLDYVFENSTPYPIKIEMTTEGRTLYCKIYGTKTDDHYVVMENKRLSTTPSGVQYKADDTVPRGTTVVEQTPYTGRKVEAYKCIYDGQGNLLSRTLVSTDTYRKRDKIVLYNPLDGVPGQIEPIPDPNAPATPAPTDPAVPVTPAPTDPAVPATPAPTDPVVPVTPPPTAPVDPVTPPPAVTEPSAAPSAPAVQEPPAPPTAPPPEGVPID